MIVLLRDKKDGYIKAVHDVHTLRPIGYQGWIETSGKTGEVWNPDVWEIAKVVESREQLSKI